MSLLNINVFNAIEALKAGPLNLSPQKPSKNVKYIFLKVTDIEISPVLVYISDGQKEYSYKLKDFVDSELMNNLTSDDQQKINDYEMYRELKEGLNSKKPFRLKNGSLITP